MHINPLITSQAFCIYRFSSGFVSFRLAQQFSWHCFAAKRVDFCATLSNAVNVCYSHVSASFQRHRFTLIEPRANNKWKSSTECLSKSLQHKFFSKIRTRIREEQLEFISYCSITREHVCWWSRDRLSHMRDWRRSGKEENNFVSKIFTLNDLKSLSTHVHYFWNRFSSAVIYMFHLLWVRLRNPCLACWSIKSY